MILTDGEIEEALREGRIIVDPPPEEHHYTSTALDLRLGERMYILRTTEELARDEPPGVRRTLVIDLDSLDMRALQRSDYVVPFDQKDGAFELPPGRFVLSETLERVELPLDSCIAARVEGRSSLARLGLVVHMTAPTIHAGFKGNIVLEMYNFGPYPLRMKPGFQICQLIFERTQKVPKGGIQTAYQGQKGVR